MTLVSKGTIGGMYLPKVQKQIMKHLTRLPNLSIKSDTVVTPGEEPAELQADVLYYTTGFTPNTEFLQGGALASALDARGMLKVDRDTLLVQDQSKVFAIGDIITPGLMDSPFMSGYATQQEAPKLAKNLIAACSGKPLKPMGKPPSKRGGILSLGPNNGTGHFDNFVLPQCVVTMMKSKDLFRKKMIHAFEKA